MEAQIVELFTIIMFFVAFYGLITSKSIIKSIACVILMETAIITFFLSIGFNSRSVPPIGTDLELIEYVSNPLPQALMITAVIVGLATTAINITMFISLFRKYKTADWDTIKKLSLE